jgi:hypothetical protein
MLVVFLLYCLQEKRSFLASSPEEREALTQAILKAVDFKQA